MDKPNNRTAIVSVRLTEDDRRRFQAALAPEGMKAQTVLSRFVLDYTSDPAIRTAMRESIAAAATRAAKNAVRKKGRA